MKDRWERKSPHRQILVGERGYCFESREKKGVLLGKLSYVGGKN